MRLWMCDPQIMCRQHLLGEHNECHMFLGSLKKKINLSGYFKNDLFEPLSLKARHDALADEMAKRGYNHLSILEIDEPIDFSHVTNQELNHRIDKDNSLYLLISRCPQCYQNYLNPQQGDIRKMYSVTKTYKFDAAHRLFTMPEDHKCRNIHGHSYVVRVSIGIEDIEKLPNPNMVVDFGLMKKFQEDLDQFDHALILHEQDPLFTILEPHVCRMLAMPFGLDVTAENMAYLFANKINHMCLTEFGIRSGQIQVEVDETVGNTASYMREIGGV